MIAVGDFVKIESGPLDPDNGRVGKVIRAKHNYFGSSYVIKLPGKRRPRTKQYPRRELIKLQ